MPRSKGGSTDVSRRLVAATLAATALAGCAMSDDKLANMLVAPGKFDLYTCPELATKASEIGKRQQTLEGLMAKAGSDTSGKLVSTLAYRPDYLSARGEMNDLRQAQAAKNCDRAEGYHTATSPTAPQLR